MAVAYTAKERAGLDAKARALLEACPDVGSFIRRGLGRDPEGETYVYLRTALDPAPVVTKAGEFQGLLNAATRWLRRQGVGPSDVVSLLAANCPASSVLYWAAMSSASIQPLNLLFTREAIAAQLNASKAKILFTPPPGSPGGLYEKSEGLQTGGFRREVQPRRQHWFLNEKSDFPFRTPAFCSVSRGQRRLGEKEYRTPSVTPGVALRPELDGAEPGARRRAPARRARRVRR